jgi:flagellar protein FlaH
MGGPIPWGSLTLIEGKHATGKSVLCQHLTYGALQSDSGVAYYTSETGSPSLISQMASLGLDVMDYFLLDKLRIFPLELPDQRFKAPNQLERLLRHMAGLPPEFEFIVVDSLTPLLPHCPPDALAEFFTGSRQLCREGKTIALTLDPRPLVTSTGDQIPFWCDVHLRLRLETVTVERVVRAMDVFKPIHEGAVNSPKVNFDVHPGHGMTIIWPKPASQ